MTVLASAGLARFAAAAAAAAGGSPAPPSFAPAEPMINGLAARDSADVSFPVTGGFVLSWSVAHNGTLPPGQGPAAFVVDLVGSLAPPFPSSVAAPAATPLTWSSGKMASTAPLLSLPSTLTSRFAPGATFTWKVRLYGGGSSPPTSYVSGTFDTAPSAARWGGAAWIGGASELRTDLRLPTTSPIVRARAHATGVGAFELVRCP
jgi:hypothetical protein